MDNTDDVNIQKIFDKMLKQKESENRVKQLREDFAMSKHKAFRKTLTKGGCGVSPQRIKIRPKSFLEYLKTFFVIVSFIISCYHIGQ
jgi:hypothetical protein